MMVWSKEEIFLKITNECNINSTAVAKVCKICVNREYFFYFTEYKKINGMSKEMRSRSSGSVCQPKRSLGVKLYDSSQCCSKLSWLLLLAAMNLSQNQLIKRPEFKKVTSHCFMLYCRHGNQPGTLRRSRSANLPDYRPMDSPPGTLR